MYLSSLLPVNAHQPLTLNLYHLCISLLTSYPAQSGLNVFFKQHFSLKDPSVIMVEKLQPEKSKNPTNVISSLLGLKGNTDLALGNIHPSFHVLYPTRG